LRVSNIRIVEERDFCELRAEVSFQTHWVWGDAPFPLWYRYPREYGRFLSADNGDPFVAALLPAAMVLHEPLSIEAAVSDKLMRALPQIQSIYQCWDSSYERVAIDASGRRESCTSQTSAARVGLFFSMGVDSSYTLAKNLTAELAADEPITHLILVNGFDIYLWDAERFPPLLAAVHRVAGELSKTVLPVTTNLREFSDRVVNWVRAYHGAALASVVLALGRHMRKVHISASQTYSRLIPSGAHPLLDPLWSSESVTLVHDGLEAERQEKIAFLAQTPVLLENLRVCATSELSNAYNCGTCEKCLRTMIGLRAAGLLHRCATLPHTIDLAAVTNIRVQHPIARNTLIELRNLLGDSEDDRALRDALSFCLERSAQR
jgi:hypothetical protein